MSIFQVSEFGATVFDLMFSIEAARESPEN